MRQLAEHREQCAAAEGAAGGARAAVRQVS
jgi:hypothetical protein